jgi:primary-amine oxidase
MMRRFGPYALGTLFIVSLGQSVCAQTTQAGDELIVKALESLQVPFTKGKDSYRFKLNNRPTVLLSSHNGGKLLIKTALPDRKPSLEALNRYNEEIAFTTRAVRYSQDGLVLEAGLDCRLGGVTVKSLGQYIAGFGQDLRAFESFLAKADKSSGKPLPDGIGEAANPDENPAINPRPVETKPISMPISIPPGKDDKEVTIEFPTQATEPRETAWKIIWDMKTGSEAAQEGFKVGGRDSSPVLFQIKQAYYRPGPKAQWLQVLENAHPSEFYVPYFFQNTRFFDLQNVGSYGKLNAHDGGPRSRLLGKEQRVMVELRDRGLAYKHGDLARRGEELVLWANFVAGNYTYLVEFCFHDDGTIAFKHAPTGYNFFEHFDSAAHMHNCLWRIGVKLGPVAPSGQVNASNDVYLVKLPNDPKNLGPSGKLDIVPVRNESYHDFEAKEFTRLRVTNGGYSVFPESKTRTRLPISYDLVPLTQGTARHYEHKDEAFTLHDFWVTRSDCPEKMYVKLPAYFSKAKDRPLAGSDGVTLWHMSSLLHVPRGEDGIYAGSNLDNGQALVSFTSVELRPRNLFVKTPLYKPEQPEPGR